MCLLDFDSPGDVDNQLYLLSQISTIAVLNLQNLHLVDDTMQKQLGHLHLPCLQFLNISCNQLIDSDDYFFESENFPVLKELIIHTNFFTKISIFSNLTTLKLLDLGNNRI